MLNRVQHDVVQDNGESGGMSDWSELPAPSDSGTRPLVVSGLVVSAPLNHRPVALTE